MNGEAPTGFGQPVDPILGTSQSEGPKGSGAADGESLERPTVPVLRAPGGPTVPLPRYATDGAAGADLFAAIESPLDLVPLEVTMVPTGLCLQIPTGWEGQVRARSGLAARHGVLVVNAPGTIDSDYRGEIKVLLTTLARPYRIEPGDRIAQLVLARVGRADFLETTLESPTERGEGGFGHTGRRD